jgi:hypothetical protein
MVAGGRGAQRRLPPEGVPTTDSTPKGVAAELAPAHGVRTSLGRFSGDVVAALLNHRLPLSSLNGMKIRFGVFSKLEKCG